MFRQRNENGRRANRAHRFRPAKVRRLIFRFLFRVLGKRSVALPGSHCGTLDRFVGGLAIGPGAGQSEEDRLTEIKTFRQTKISLHVFGVNLKLLDQVAQLREHVIEQHAGIGQDDAFGAGMADVAFVPEGDVLKRGEGVSPHDTGKAAQAFGRDRVALVRHG